MSEAKKCAHEGCTCLAAEGSKYCSTYCEDTVGVTTLSCDCKHPGLCGRPALNLDGGGVHPLIAMER